MIFEHGCCQAAAAHTGVKFLKQKRLTFAVSFDRENKSLTKQRNDLLRTWNLNKRKNYTKVMIAKDVGPQKSPFFPVERGQSRVERMVMKTDDCYFPSSFLM